MRHVYRIGSQMNTTGNDSNALFDYFLIAYGGKDIVTKEGKLHVDDPQVKEAAIRTVSFPTAAYKEEFVPPGAINWNDADDNNAFHAKQIVMDLDGTISTEVAIINNKQDYDDIETMGLPLSNDGRVYWARRYRISGYSTRPTPASRTRMCGPPRGPTSSMAA
jgi:multiple sugar transport system substrate-binding protein